MTQYQRLTVDETEVDEVGRVTLVRFREKQISDMIEIERLGEELYRVIEEKTRKRLVVDFSDVAFFSSAAIGKLISLNGRVKAQNGVMKLCHIEPEILDVFHVCKLDTLFDIHANMERALASFEN